jgi:hypothetical protein
MAREIENRHRMQNDVSIDYDGSKIGVVFSRLVLRRRVTRACTMARQSHKEEQVEGGPEVYTAVAQQSLVPSVSRSKLWLVTCMTGKEQELVL